ncbi:MAG: cupin domain-containing protein [Bacteroidales bacterium]|nr:cupin domain-containing protein [Bacteroidales bacterium]
MKIIDWKRQEIKETPHKVDVRSLYDTDDAQVMHIQLKPGEALKPHITPVDVFFFVLEGIPIIQVGTEMQEVAADMLVESPKDIVHCLYNHSDKPARIMVVKAPRPVKSTRLL